MLATGGSIVHALDVLKSHGVTRMRLLSIFGAPEGVAAVSVGDRLSARVDGLASLDIEIIAT